jgi:hypothetical protein
VGGVSSSNSSQHLRRIRARHFLASWVHLGDHPEVVNAPRGSPIKLLIRSAATHDNDLLELLEEMATTAASGSLADMASERVSAGIVRARDLLRATRQLVMRHGWHQLLLAYSGPHSCPGTRITSKLVMDDMLTNLLTNRFDLHQSPRYAPERRPRSSGWSS